MYIMCKLLYISTDIRKHILMVQICATVALFLGGKLFSAFTCDKKELTSSHSSLM